jgi:hypothetical protein
MLRKLRFVIAGLILILANQAVGYAVQAARPETALAAGNTRYYVLSHPGSSITSSTAWTNLPGMSTSFTIPSGKHGDVIMLFCGLGGVTGGNLGVRALIGAAAALPSSNILTDVSTYETHCAQYYKLGLGAGSRTIQMQWHTTGGTSAMSELSLLVLVNIH